MDLPFTSAVVILLLVIDPLGNIPVFVSVLASVEPARRAAVMLREWAIAFVVLLVSVFFGNALLELLALSDSSLNIAGGVILFLIALRMIFRRAEGVFGDVTTGEPFIVPLAIPAIAGPSAIATVILFVSRAPHRMLEWIAALSGAMLLALVVLLFAERISRLAGERGLAALERLMGLILTAIAVEMLLRGIEGFVRQLQ
ncbi:MAG: MarC family protein [Betaproteobacteria bacterium]|nr:MarC family protein [Betaproteobacteria bacterium]MBI3938329.1 MarC family protein [Betaproteobacteria bacterium]